SVGGHTRPRAPGSGAQGLTEARTGFSAPTDATGLLRSSSRTMPTESGALNPSRTWFPRMLTTVISISPSMTIDSLSLRLSTSILAGSLHGPEKRGASPGWILIRVWSLPPVGWADRCRDRGSVFSVRWPDDVDRVDDATNALDVRGKLLGDLLEVIR